MTAPAPPLLWHFTCAHSVAGIERTGTLRPHRHPMIGQPLVWLTDLAQPFRDALGLTSHTLRCDRTEYRFLATDISETVWWPSYSRARGLARQVCTALEAAPGAMPRHWWVSTVLVPARRADR